MFGHESKPTIVYRYDVRSFMKPTLSPIDFVRTQLTLARAYRNKLLNAEIAGRKAYREKRSELYPDFAALEETALKASAAVEEANTKIKLDKVSRHLTGKKQRTSTGLITVKREAVNARKAARAALKFRRDEISGDTVLADAGNEAREKLRVEADQWANENGLYQATKRKIVESVSQTCRTSQADPVFTKWDGSGRLSCQIQAQAKVLARVGPCTWEAITLGRYDSLIRVREEKVPVPTGLRDAAGNKIMTEKSWTIISVRFGSDVNRNPIFVDCPVQTHRVPPPDAVIKWAELVCKRNGRDFVYYLCLQVAHDDGWEKEDRADSGMVAVNPGWRMVPEGLRVAYWVGSDGEEGQLVIPNTSKTHHGTVDQMQKVNDLQSIRDKLFEAMKPKLKAHFGDAVPEWAAETIKFIDKIRSKDRIIKMVRDWQGELPDFLKKWYDKDIHLEKWGTFQRARFGRWRTAFYRQFAAMLRRKYKTVVFDNTKYADMRRNPEPEQVKIDAVIQYRNIASPGDLRELVQANMDVIKVDAEHCTATCHKCNEVCEWDRLKLEHMCEHCGTQFDQDANHCRNALNRATEKGPDGQESAA